jgi:hypothetical protein
MLSAVLISRRGNNLESHGFLEYPLSNNLFNKTLKYIIKFISRAIVHAIGMQTKQQEESGEEPRTRYKIEFSVLYVANRRETIERVSMRPARTSGIDQEKRAIESSDEVGRQVDG